MKKSPQGWSGQCSDIESTIVDRQVLFWKKVDHLCCVGHVKIGSHAGNGDDIA